MARQRLALSLRPEGRPAVFAFSQQGALAVLSVGCFVIPSFMMAGTVSSSAPFPISVPLAVAVFTVPLDASHSRKQGEGET